MTERTVIIGTRGSKLALWQAHHVQDELKKLGVTAELNIIKTQGDRIQNLSFDKMEGKGFFTKEIEAALLSGEIDLAVHSHKDLETTSPEGLMIAAVSDREDPRELLLIRKEVNAPNRPYGLHENAVVGTSSARRKSQLLGLVDGIQLKDLRGNVPTRINKLREGQYDAIMLAAAGVKRLEIDLSDLRVEHLEPTKFIPAPAQGVLALQIRDTDSELAQVLSHMNHTPTQIRIETERSVLREFHGGCQVPLGAYCTQEDGNFRLWAAASGSWEEPPRHVYFEGPDAGLLAEKAVEALKKKAHPGSSSVDN